MQIKQKEIGHKTGIKGLGGKEEEFSVGKKRERQKIGKGN